MRSRVGVRRGSGLAVRSRCAQTSRMIAVAGAGRLHRGRQSVVMKVAAGVLAAIGLAWLGLGLAQEHAERGFVDPSVASAFVALIVLAIGMTIGWASPCHCVFWRLRQSWTRPSPRRS